MKFRDTILSWRYMTLLIILIGVVLRILYGRWMYLDLLEGDAGYYYEEAKTILAGDYCQTYWPPGVPWFTAFLLKILGVSPLAVIIGMTGLYILFVTQLNRLLLRLGDRAVANIIHFIFAVYPAFIHHAVAPLSHLPVAICMVVIADLIWKLHLSEKGQWPELVLLGLVLGLGTLFRPGFITILPVVLFFLIRKYRLRLHYWLTPLLISMLMITGWQAWTYSCSGRWMWVNDATSMNFFIGNNPYTPIYRTWWLGSQDESHNPNFIKYYHLREEILSLPPEERNQVFSQKANQHIREFPGIFLIRTINRIRVFFAFDSYAGSALGKKNLTWGALLMIPDALAYIILGLFAIWGMVGKRSPIPRPVRLTLLFLIPAYGLPYFFAFSHPNYHLPIVPLISMFAASAMLRTTPRIFSFEGFTRRSRWFVYLAFLSFLYVQFEWLAHLVDRYVSVMG